METDAANKVQSVAFVSLLFLVAFIVIKFELLRHADFWLSDYQVKAHAETLVPDPDIVVIDIDDYSLKKMQNYAGRWVWPRSVHAELIEVIATYQPKALVFDILFSEADIYRPDADSYFNEVVAEQTNVYFAMLQLKASSSNGGSLLSDMPMQLGLEATKNADDLARAHLLLPAAVSPENWRLGTINYVEDSDGVGRQYDVWRDISGWRLPSLSAKVVKDLGVALPEQKSIHLQWRTKSLFDDTNDGFQRFSYADIYEAVTNDAGDNEVLKQLSGKILIIGSTAAGLFDVRATPISSQYPAVYILATALDNLKNQRHVQIAEQWWQYLLSALMLTMLTYLFLTLAHFKAKLVWSGCLCVVATIILLIVSSYMLTINVILYVAGPLILASFTYVVLSFIFGYREYLQRQKAINMFGRFLDPKVVNSLVEQGKLNLENTSKHAKLTVLFSDIRGFTTMSEKYSAEQIVTLLNNYFDRQVRTIFDNNGTLDKFIGDCIMAFWGAPVANQNQEVDAIKTALTMAEQLAEFKQTLPEELQGFDVGIGIHTGDAVVGMIGAEQRVDYTAIGDTVNLASRIEGVTKNICQILVSEQTKLGCERNGSVDFDFEYKGEFEVKGRKQAVKLFEPKRKSDV